MRFFFEKIEQNEISELKNKKFRCFKYGEHYVVDVDEPDDYDSMDYDSDDVVLKMINDEIGKKENSDDDKKENSDDESDDDKKENSDDESDDDKKENSDDDKKEKSDDESDDD
jgi:hypothetical protein